MRGMYILLMRITMTILINMMILLTMMPLLQVMTNSARGMQIFATMEKGILVPDVSLMMLKTMMMMMMMIFFTTAA